MLNFKIFNNYPNLKYGISEKKHGDMGSLSIMKTDSHESKKKFEQNRNKFFEKANVDGLIYFPHFISGNNVDVLTEENFHKKLTADGLVTSVAGIFPILTVADCFPVYFYDHSKNAIGLVHAGWKGVVSNIIGNIINSFITSFNSNPKDILMAIGPGIQKDHFAVKEDVIDKFQSYQQYIEEKGESKYLIDLPGIITEQAQKAGIDKIESCGFCTYCHSDTYFSFRRDKPTIPEVMIAYIGINN